MIWLPERQVRDRRCDLGVGVEADLALHERVAVDLEAVRVADERLLAEAQQPAGVVASLDDDVGGLLLEHVKQLARREHGLVGGDLGAHRAADVREPVHVAGGRRLLDPVEVVPLEQADPVDRGRAVPGLVRVDPQQRLGPDRLANRGDAGVVVARSPSDLEVDDAVTLPRQLAGVGREPLGLVALEKAEVVELLLDAAAEERPRRHAERPAERIPARDLEPRDEEVRELGEHLPAALGPHRPQDRLDVAGRTADELAREQLAVRGDGALVLADRLSVAGDALVGVDGEEDEVRAHLRPAGPVKLLSERDRERRRVDAGDLHGSSFRP